MLRRQAELMQAILFSDHYLRQEPPEQQALAQNDRDKYFIGQIRSLKGDFYNTAARVPGIEVWQKDQYLHMTDMMEKWGDSAPEAAQDFLEQHFKPIEIKAVEGIANVIHSLKEQGAILVMLTDALPDHAMRTALTSELVDGIFDLVISRDFIQRRSDGPLQITPYAETILQATPHYIVKNVDRYPKDYPEIYPLIAKLLNVTVEDMALIDDHKGVCDRAMEAGVKTLLAYYAPLCDTGRLAVNAFSHWTDYYKIKADFLRAMDETPATAAGNHIVLRHPSEITQYISGAPGAKTCHISAGASVHSAPNGLPHLLTLPTAHPAPPQTPDPATQLRLGG
jgi:beta-phosphoglucomutase-like phosphatase (HAD superfamily)